MWSSGLVPSQTTIKDSAISPGRPPSIVTNVRRVSLTDSGDGTFFELTIAIGVKKHARIGWDFTTVESTLNPPILRIRSTDVLPAVAPTLQPNFLFSHYIFIAIDTELLANDPSTSYTNETSISVDVSSGEGVTQSLLKFGLSAVSAEDLPGDVIAMLSLFTVSSTSRSITAYKMIQAWDEDATRNDFGGDGVEPNGVEAATMHSIKIH